MKTDLENALKSNVLEGMGVQAYGITLKWPTLRTKFEPAELARLEDVGCTTPDDIGLIFLRNALLRYCI